MDTPRIAGVELLVPPAELRLPAQGQRRDRFPLHERGGSVKGAVYVRFGKVETIHFADWCRGLAAGRSYVSDGYAHALEFTVGGKQAGDRLELAKPGPADVRAKVAFAARVPLAVAHWRHRSRGRSPAHWRYRQPARPKARGRVHRERRDAAQVELMVNGRVVAKSDVPADDQVHDLHFSVSMAE